MRLDMMLKTDGIQFAGNYMVMRSRTSFIDVDNPARHRKKLSLWLKMDNARRLVVDSPECDGFS